LEEARAVAVEDVEPGRRVEGRLVREMVIDGADTDARLLADVVERHAEGAGRAEAPHRRREQPVASRIVLGHYRGLFGRGRRTQVDRSLSLTRTRRLGSS